jgi:ankyrin repeat protein
MAAEGKFLHVMWLIGSLASKQWYGCLRQRPAGMDRQEWTLLQFATLNGHLAVAQLLLRNSAVASDSNAFQAVSGQGHESLIQLLLDNSADVNSSDKNCRNVLQDAGFDGQESII